MRNRAKKPFLGEISFVFDIRCASYKFPQFAPLINNLNFFRIALNSQLKPDAHRNKKHKTSVKWRNLNPVFNEEFSFETRPNELDKQSLVFTVWDMDLGKSNDFLGSLVIGYTSKGKRLKQWKDCIRSPDCFHEQWHQLSSDPRPHE